MDVGILAYHDIQCTFSLICKGHCDVCGLELKQ